MKNLILATGTMFVLCLKPFADSSSEASSITDMMNSSAWNEGMAWLNFFIFIALGYRYLFVPALKFLDQSIAQIQLNLSQEELEKKRLVQELESVRTRLSSVDAHGSSLLAEAKEDAKRLYQQTLDKGQERLKTVHSRMEAEVNSYEAQSVDNLKNWWVQTLLLKSCEDLSTSSTSLDAFQKKMHSSVSQGGNHAA
ncbi:MAG: ATP synthase F0 subunit B [Candidatus Cloacimonetes bacterium]|nr:ATP synthase F0 subunit B [Candidatus Cloacimonadota bacterium]